MSKKSTNATTTNATTYDLIKEIAPVREEFVQPERLLDADKMILDTAKTKKELALTQAKLALSQNETANLAYDNIVLQLAMKYQLKEGDVIEEAGTIIRKK